MLRNWCLWIVVLEKTLESPVDCKERLQRSNLYPKSNQTWIINGRTDAEPEAPILWPAGVKNLLIGKTLMLGKIEGKRRWGWWKMRWLDSITESVNMNWSKLWEIMEDRRAWHAAVREVPKSHTWLSNMQIARNALGKQYLLSKCQLLLFLSLLLLLLTMTIFSIHPSWSRSALIYIICYVTKSVWYKNTWMRMLLVRVYSDNPWK